jgi:flagella basal body P-ring formation protein FlgA
MLCAAACVAHAGADVLHIQADDARALQEELLTVAEERLRPAGLFIERPRASMSLSSPLPSADLFEVRPTWSADARTPPLPLTFELWPGLRSDRSAALESASSTRPIRATLAVTLLRDVLGATRRLRKGSVVTCTDLSMQRRPIRDVPKLPLAIPCEVAPDAVALRDITAGEVIRSVDVGRAPDVTAGAPVRVSVATRGVSITTGAIALADARVGDQIDVRLQHPTRTLRTRVTGPGSVQLMDGSL